MLTLATLLVLPLLAWLLWDIDRQQKRRPARAAARASVAAQMADLSRAFYSFRAQVVNDMTPALEKAARAVAELSEAYSKTPAAGPWGSGSSAGTNAPYTETGAGGDSLAAETSSPERSA